MTAAAAAVEPVVARLLAANGVALRRAVRDCLAAGPDTVRDAVVALVAEAERVIGADPRRMDRLCLTAVELGEKSGDPYLLALARMRHGDYFRVAGRFVDACARYDESAAVFRRSGYPVEAARTRIGWVWAAARLGWTNEALAAARKARAVLVAHGETFRAAGLEMSVSLLQFEQGRNRQALRTSSRALAMYRTLGEAGRAPAARVHATLALTLTRLGRYAEALDEYRFAQDAYEAMGEAVGAARIRRTRGEAFTQIGRYTAALQSLEEARTIFSRHELHEEEAQLAKVLADCYLALRRPADALELLAGDAPDRRATDTPRVAFDIAARRAVAALLLGEQQLALEALAEADRYVPVGSLEQRAWLSEQRAAILLRDGNAAEAVALARTAEVLARTAGARPRQAAALLLRGTALLAEGAIDAADRAAERARRLARSLDAAPLLARAHDLLGRLAEARGRPTAARRQYLAAIDQLEREQQGVIFEFRDRFDADRGGAYERLASLLLDAGEELEAFRTVERAKSRALADAIAGAVDLRPRGNPRVRRLSRELNEARRRYAAAFRTSREEADRPDGEAHLAELEREVAGLVQRLQIAGTDAEVAALGYAAPREPPALTPGTAIVEYFIAGADILRFWIDAHGVRAVRLRDALPRAERLLQLFLLNRDAAAAAIAAGAVPANLTVQARTILAQLWTCLLGGLDELADCRSLVVIPHGRLHYLPFHAFHDGSRYLIERAAVSYAPSATLYALCRSRTHRRRRSDPLVLAHSAGGVLPGAVQEGERIGALLGTSARSELDATRARLESDGQKASLIHIAAHGVFRPDAPLFSRIELADGALTTPDIFNLTLNATLVTLSACETGRSLVSGGDELVGLARAFLYAGAGGLVVSQWRVDDTATEAMMVDFYTALKSGATTGVALQQAQIAALCRTAPQNDGDHPFIWAGFQIIGDATGRIRPARSVPKRDWSVGRPQEQPVVPRASAGVLQRVHPSLSGRLSIL